MATLTQHGRGAAFLSRIPVRFVSRRAFAQRSQKLVEKSLCFMLVFARASTESKRAHGPLVRERYRHRPLSLDQPKGRNDRHARTSGHQGNRSLPVRHANSRHESDTRVPRPLVQKVLHGGDGTDRHVRFGGQSRKKSTRSRAARAEPSGTTATSRSTA